MNIEENYHYTECGLDNVYVEGIEKISDDGERIITILCYKELHHLIAISCLSEGALIGSELKFIRTLLGLNPQQFSHEIGIDKDQLIKLESAREEPILVEVYVATASLYAKSKSIDIATDLIKPKSELLIKQTSDGEYRLAA